MRIARLNMLVSMLAAAMLLAAVPCAGSGASPRPDFDAAAREMTALLQEYLRVDTSNPPGHERRAADFLKRVFDREGIACDVFDQGDDRANVVAVLPGSGAKRPLILLNHLDVVPADAERWTVPPFAGEIRDGYVWGRGATDMKGTAICQLMTMLLIKR
ncbi:MAG TPA: M20/M25/M40 family metallo-hydrolase, partial [Blastocatellia bacterium]|nr:M20/M25/M40 family metallo-hydrolase [Blastocatellia bacterium]